MNPVDAGVILILVVLIVAGIRHGLIGQCLLLVATIASFLVAAVAAYLVATHTGPGRALPPLTFPIVFFVALAVSSWLLHLVARGLTLAVHRLPFATLDRFLGGLIAAVIGVVLLSVLALGIVSLRWENPVSRELRDASSVSLLLDAGHRVAAAGASRLELLRPLAERFEGALAETAGDIL